MPKPPGQKTGPDFARLTTLTNATGLQKDNPQLFQVLTAFGDASRVFQGFIEQKYPTLDGQLADLFTFTQDIINELENVRNNSKFSVSLANSAPQPVQSKTLTEVTFDISIFDDGLMFNIDENPTGSEITLNANGQYFISITCEFGQEVLT